MARIENALKPWSDYALEIEIENRIEIKIKDQSHYALYLTSIKIEISKNIR